MRFDKAVALVALAFCVGMAPKAQAAYIVDLYQDGSNVVATGSGSLDVRDLAASGTAPSVFHGMNPQIAFLTTGPGSIDDYGGISGPTSFGFGGRIPSSTQSGDPLGLNATYNALFVPSGYVSGTALTSSAIWDNTTLAALGVTDGTYVWTWGSGADADSFTLNALTPAPEPGSLALLGAGLAALGLQRRRRKAG